MWRRHSLFGQKNRKWIHHMSIWSTPHTQTSTLLSHSSRRGCIFLCVSKHVSKHIERNTDINTAMLSCWSIRLILPFMANRCVNEIATVTTTEHNAFPKQRPHCSVVRSTALLCVWHRLYQFWGYLHIRLCSQSILCIAASPSYRIVSIYSFIRVSLSWKCCRKCENSTKTKKSCPTTPR